MPFALAAHRAASLSVLMLTCRNLESAKSSPMWQALMQATVACRASASLADSSAAPLPSELSMEIKLRTETTERISGLQIPFRNLSCHVLRKSRDGVARLSFS